MSKNLDELRLKIKALGKAELQVGWFETAKSAEGQPVAGYAAVNEFGSSHTPARPFLRPAIAKNRTKWAAQLSGKTMAMAPEQTMDMIGAVIVGDIQKSIKSVMTPPLDPKTVKRKGFAKPLIDTGLMLQTVTYKRVS